MFIDHELLAFDMALQRDLDHAILKQEMSTLSMLLRDCKEAEEGGDLQLASIILAGVYSLLGLDRTVN